MFKRYEIPCHKEDFHISHEYFAGWRHFFHSVICPGKLRTHDDTYDIDAPGTKSGLVTPDSPPQWVIKDHKHRLSLTGWAFPHKEGILGPDTKLSFTCKDQYCMYECQTLRSTYNERVLDYSKVNQTWPG